MSVVLVAVSRPPPSPGAHLCSLAVRTGEMRERTQDCKEKNIQVMTYIYTVGHDTHCRP